MKRVFGVLFAITLVLLMLAACKPKEAAPAEEQPLDQPASIFTRTDTDNDGVITSDEHKQRMETLFDKIDTNHDGSLDTAGIDAHIQNVFAQMDTQTDAQITAEEHNKFFLGEDLVEQMATDKPVQGHAWHWANRDYDADGQITKAEYANSMKSQFMTRDANSDGNVSKEEFDAYQRNIFAGADANGDGTVSKEEFLSSVSL